jgi:plasmid stability protein
MTTLTIRNLDPAVKARLRVRAAQHGHSMEEEARKILRASLADEAAPAGQPNNLVDAIRAIVEPLGGMDDLEPPPRQPMRDPPDFRA